MQPEKTGPEPREVEWIVRAKRGEKEAFTCIARRYHRPVYGVIYSLVGNAEDAMDLTQDTFFRAFRNLDRFETGRPFQPWIYRIARNLALSFLEKRNRQGFSLSLDTPPEPDARPVEIPGADPSPRDLVDEKDLEAQLQEALDTLTDADREIIVLKDVQDCSYQEIATLLDVPIGTVMSRLYYARDRLRKKLKKYLV